MLFRPARPALLALQPNIIVTGTPEVEVRGMNLRPALRVVVGSYGVRLLLADVENAVLHLPPDLLIGAYDVHLLDDARPVMTILRGLIVEAPLPVVPDRPVRRRVAGSRYIVESENAVWNVGLFVVVRDRALDICTLFIDGRQAGGVTCQPSK